MPEVFLLHLVWFSIVAYMVEPRCQGGDSIPILEEWVAVGGMCAASGYVNDGATLLFVTNPQVHLGYP